MRAGGAPKNPYDGIIQTFTRYPRRRHRSSAHRSKKCKGGTKFDEHTRSQEIEGRSEIEWNHQETSSPRLRRSSDSRDFNVVESDAMRTELSSDKINLGASGGGIYDENRCVVSSKPNGLIVEGEGDAACRDVKFSPIGYGSDCGGEGERKRPIGWSAMNTKAERMELTQSDEEQMLQLSQGSVAQEGKLTEQPFSPVTSDTNVTPNKRRKQQTRTTQKRPHRAPAPIRSLARDIFEVLQSDPEPLERRKQFADGQIEKKEETSGMKTIECSHITSNPKRAREVGRGLQGYGSNPQGPSSEKPRRPDRRCRKPENDARCKDSQRETTLRENYVIKGFKETHCDEMMKDGKRMNVISTMHGFISPRELEGTSGDRKHANGLLQSEVGSHNCPAPNSNSGQSWTEDPLLPSGEDGYSLSREGVQMGLQMRQTLLGHFKDTQDDYQSPRAESQSPVCQDIAGPATTREEKLFQPSYEELSEGKQRSAHKAITVVQPSERDTNMKLNLKSAPEVEQSLFSPSTAKRRVRRKNRKADITEREKQLPDKHEIIAKEESQQSEKSGEAESVTHIPFTETRSEPVSPSNQGKNGVKARKKKHRSRKPWQRGNEGAGVTAKIDHARGLDDGEQGHAQRKKERGTEAGSREIISLDGSHSKNTGSRSSDYSYHPKTNNMNEKEKADGAEATWPEPVTAGMEQLPLTGGGNRSGSVHPTASEESTISQRQDHDSHMKPPIKPEFNESIVDVDNYTAKTENVKAAQAGIKLKGEHLGDLVDPKELSKQSQLLRKRPEGLRKSRTDGARHEPRPKALDELSDNEDSKNNESRPAVPSSRSRGRSGTVEVARVKKERTHPMTTRRRASRFADTLHRGVAMIDLTDAGDKEDAATTSRTAQGDDDIAESLRELQRLSLQDRSNSFSERPRCKYLTPLSSDENKLATQLFTRTKLETRIVTIAEAGITLRGESFKRLRGTRWLDDEVLNTYVSLINSRNDAVFHELSEEHRSGIPRTYMFNTYFFTRLCCGSSGFDYPGVQGWTKRAKVDILQKDIILVPINLGNHHWVLSVIDMEHQEVLYLDSMRGPDAAKAMPKLKRWVFEELRNKHGESVAQQYNPNSWKEVKHSYRVRRIGVLPASLEAREAKAGRVAKVPRQSDGGSCGVFSAKMADCLSLGIKVYFTQADIPLIRRRMALDLFNGYVPL